MWTHESRARALARSRHALLIALAALATSGASGAVAPATDFGGAYPIGSGLSRKRESVDLHVAEKQAEFKDFRYTKQWHASTVVELTPKLFRKSIKANAKSRVPDARRFQRYNYVVQNGKIYVAVWNEVDAEDICGVKKGPPYVNMKVRGGTMVNFYPETLKELPPMLRLPSTPCTYVNAKGRRTGVLDAHSKHFMLAQGPGTTIAEYEPGWANATVDYAGEILVVLDPARCYIINQGSGTYQPMAGEPGKEFRYLEAVARLLKEQAELDEDIAVWRTDPREENRYAGKAESKCWGKPSP